MDESDDRFEPLTESERAAAQAGDDAPKDDGECVMPVPSDAPPVPDAHPELGKPSCRWPYRDAAGRLLFEVWRFDPVGKRKIFLPLSLWRDPSGEMRWHSKAVPAPRPLYGLDRLAANPGAPVVICEGEKSADEAARVFPKSVCMTSSGGCKAEAKANFEPLAGRRVLIWPDADEAGATYAASVAGILHALGCEVSIIDAVALAGMAPDGGQREPVKGWDAADAAAEWKDLAVLRKAAHGLAKPFEPDAAKPNGGADNGDDAKIARLAALRPADYERARTDAALKLGVRVSILDKLVAAKRPNGDRPAGQGRPLQLPEPEPWDDPVDGAELLAAIAKAIKTYIVLSDNEANTIALWIVHTYCFELFQCSPRLAVVSPEKRCGKTTLLDVIGEIVTRPLPASNITAAALFRTIDLAKPTLLIDEADTFLPENEELRGILNAGHRCGAAAVRLVGDNHEARSFATYAPVAIALIGKLPDTLDDRSIHVSLRRRLDSEVVCGFRFGKVDHLKVLGRQAARFVLDNREALAESDPDLPGNLVNREADNWRPLFVIAGIAGGDWLLRAASAASAAEQSAEENLNTQLLHDIQDAFAEHQGLHMPSADLTAALNGMPDRPWVECNHGKALSQTGLARRLKNFGIRPKDVGPEHARVKGYLLESFADAFSRYCQPPPFQTAQPRSAH
jgi:hypothetical protein